MIMVDKIEMIDYKVYYGLSSPIIGRSLRVVIPRETSFILISPATLFSGELGVYKINTPLFQPLSWGLCCPFKMMG